MSGWLIFNLNSFLQFCFVSDGESDFGPEYTMPDFISSTRVCACILLEISSLRFCNYTLYLRLFYYLFLVFI